MGEKGNLHPGTDAVRPSLPKFGDGVLPKDGGLPAGKDGGFALPKNGVAAPPPASAASGSGFPPVIGAVRRDDERPEDRPGGPVSGTGA